MVRWGMFGACAALFLSLNGCVLFAPERAFEPTMDSSGKRPVNPLSSATDNLENAKAYANEVRDDIIGLETEASIIKSTSTLALLGTSGASVGAAAFRGSRDLIAGFSVATAGLLSIQYGTGIATKQAVLDNARVAIDCAIQTAEKLNSAPGVAASTVTGAGSSGGGRAAPLANSPGFDEATSAMGRFAASAENQSRALGGTAAQVLEIPPAERAAIINRPQAVTARVTQGVAAQTASQLLSKASGLASAAQQAASDAKADTNQALSTASASAPFFLVTAATDIEDATIALLHSAEPGGQDLVGQVKSDFQNQVQGSANKLKSAKQNSDTAAAKMGAAAELARSAQLNADQAGPAASDSATGSTKASALASDATTAQQGMANNAANADVLGTVLSNATACNKLSQLAQPAL